MNNFRKYIRAENKAVEELELKGYKIQGRTYNFKEIAVINPSGKIETFKDYQTALEKIQEAS